MSAIADKVREADDTVEVLIDVPEWDVKLLLLSPSVVERDAMLKRYTKWEEGDDGEIMSMVDPTLLATSIVIACAHDPETRERAFEPADMEMLSTKNGLVVGRIADVCAPLVGLGRKKGDGATDPGKERSSTDQNSDTEPGSPGSSAGQ